MDIETGGYGDQDKDGDQPAESDALPDDNTQPNFTPPSTGPFSQQRQKQRAFQASVNQAKISAANKPKKKLGGSP